MLRFIVLTALLTPSVSSVSAREFTKPPSIALRSEISYVAETVLTNKKYLKKSKQWQLNFLLLHDIHNQSQKTIQILVDNDLASSLSSKEKYIIAYRTHRKTKIDGITRYLPLENGPVPMSVQGAEPAIFRSHEQLKKQMATNPQMAQSNPKQLIQNILTGINNEDPKIQEFFIRELINWNGLPAQLNPNQLEQLLNVFLDSSVSSGTLTAFLENRQDFHSALGVKEMAPKVTEMLTHIPINLSSESTTPTLIYEALNFLKSHKLGTWDIYQRWTRSNNPSITELALLQLHQICPEKTLQLAKSRLTESLVSNTSRRILKRYVQKYE